MDKISFKNNLNTIQNPQNAELQQRMQSQENFGAIDKDKLKQDTVELANKTKETAKENFIFRGLKNLGVKDPKKFLKSVGLTLVTTIGFAALGKRTLKTMTKAGIGVDDVLLNKDNFLGKIYCSVTDGLGKAKTKVAGLFKKSKTVKEVSDTLSDVTRKARPKQDLAKGMGQGFAPQFGYAVKDMLEASFLKQHTETFGVLKKQFGKRKALALLTDISKDPSGGLEKLKTIIGDEKTAKKLFDEISTGNNKFKQALTNLLGENGAKKYFESCVEYRFNGGGIIEFADEFTKDVAGNFNINMKDKKAVLEMLEGIKKGNFKGKDLSAFTEITMNREGLIGGWWPANIVDSIGKKLGFFKKKGFGKGNLGDGLWRYNVSRGKTSNTAVGKLVQKSLMIPGESISNFVCDNAGMNFFVVSSVLSMFNNMQDAPKGKRKSIVADDFIGGIGSLAIATPLAFKTTYGLASLANLEGKTVGSKLLKQVGKIFNLGLKDGAGPFARFGGGALRFVLIMFVFSGLFKKPLDKITHKIFGKPYNKAEDEKMKAQEAQLNQVIPELGISQKELMEKIQKNPAAIQRLQSDPNLLAQAQQNPKIILDLLDNKYNPNAQNQTNAQGNKKPQMSAANRNLLNRTATNNQAQNQANAQMQNPMQNQAQPMAQNNIAQNSQTQQNALEKNKSQEESKKQTQIRDTATYIPSSDFIAKNALSEQTSQEVNTMLAKSDKILAQAEKYI